MNRIELLKYFIELEQEHREINTLVRKIENVMELPESIEEMTITNPKWKCKTKDEKMIVWTEYGEIFICYRIGDSDCKFEYSYGKRHIKISVSDWCDMEKIADIDVIEFDAHILEIIQEIKKITDNLLDILDKIKGD